MNKTIEFAWGKGTLSEYKDKFSNFNGFGIFGNYLSHSKKSVSEVAREVLEGLEGKRVIVNCLVVRNMSLQERKYHPDRFFKHLNDEFVINGHIKKGYLNAVNTDNILIDVLDDNYQSRYEIQRIVKGNTEITELRRWD